MKTFEEAKAESDLLEQEEHAAGAALNAFPRGPMGLTPDAVRATIEYKNAKTRWGKAFKALQCFNVTFVKQFAKELREERKRRYNK